jgi:hypothetical protein
MEDVRCADISYQVRDDAVPTDQGDDYSITQDSLGAALSASLADAECLQADQGVWSTWQDSDMSTPTGTSMDYVEEALDDYWPGVESEMEPERESLPVLLVKSATTSAQASRQQGALAKTRRRRRQTSGHLKER